MKSLLPAMVTHLAGRGEAGGSTSLAWCVLLELVDGTVLGFTQHSREISFDLGEGHGVIVHKPKLGGTLSNLAQGVGLDAGNVEIRGPISDVVTEPAIVGGRFDDAQAWIFRVNWQKLVLCGAIRHLRGFTTDLHVEGDEWVGEIQDYRAKLQQQILNAITTSCRLDFAGADGECGVTPTEEPGTVTVASDAHHLTLAFAGTYADNFFNKGKLIGLTGVNAGLTRKIEKWAATGALELFDPFPDLPDLGDTFTIRTGCSKLRFSSDATIPTCKSYDNVVRMRAYPDGPGSEKLMRVAIPGEGDQ